MTGKTRSNTPFLNVLIRTDPLEAIYSSTIRYDTITVTIHYDVPMSPILRPTPACAFLPILFEGDDMTCRKALLKDYSQYTTLTGEKIWAYQLIRNYCCDWMEVSVGALIDPAASAGAHVLNANFGIRVYECSIGGDGQWSKNSTGVAIGRGTPFVFPGWQSPVLIPWMGKNVNVMVEFYTADTIVAGTTLELSIAPIQEGA